MAKKKDPVSLIVEQISGILNLVQKKPKKGEASDGTLPDDIFDRLQEIETGIDLLEQSYEKAKQQMGINEEEVFQEINQAPDQISEDERKILSSLTDLRLTTQAIADAAKESMENEEAKNQMKPKNRPGTDLGTRKGWKKL